MTEYSTTAPSTGPLSPLFGTATFSTLSPTQTPLSPSRISSSFRSATPIASSYDSDDASSGRQMRRIVVSPSPTSRGSDTYTYSDENSFDDAAEVEAALELHGIEEQISETEELLSEMSRSRTPTSDTYTSYTGPSTYTSYTGTASGSTMTGSYQSGDYRSATAPLDSERQRLSTISEHTENTPSRPTSYAQSGGEGNRLSGHTEGRASPALHGHGRSSTEPGARASTPGRALGTIPGRRVGEIVAALEERSGTTSPIHSPGHSRTASAPSGPRSMSPLTSTQSRSMPTISSLIFGSSNLTGTGYNSSSRPSSPSRSSVGTSMSYSGLNTTMSSVLSPPPLTPSSVSRNSRFQPSTIGTTTTPTSRTPRTFTESVTASDTNTTTDTFTRTFTTTSMNTYSGTPTSSSRTVRRASPTSSDLSDVVEKMKAWRQRWPIMGKSAKKSSTTPSPTQGEGIFSTRRRASRGGARLRDRALQNPNRLAARRASDSSVDAVGPMVSASASESLSTSGLMPPPFDIAELGQYAGASETQEPLRIGLLWYLNVHAPPPYRWQRCQALLYPHMLLLSWIAPGGGRGVVTLDLLNCTEVRSTASPTNPAVRDDVGTIAARLQSEGASASADGAFPEQVLMETLTPFQLLYSDGIERLAADSPKERNKWVNAIWEVLDRDVSIPDRSATGSPTGSIRTIRSFDSSGSTQSGTGSALTRYVPLLENIPDISDLQSISGSSTRTGLSHRPSLASVHRVRATDDSALSDQGYVYRGDPRVIAPSRSSSLRRTSSMTDLDEEFSSAVRRARHARPGLGFGLGLAGGIPIGDGSPVTVSSGPRLGHDVVMSPPPSVGRGSDRARSHTSDSASSASDDAFFTARSATHGSATSSFYSSSAFTRDMTTTDTRTGTGTGTGLVTDETALEFTSGSGSNLITSTLSSASLLGGSYSGSGTSYSSTSPSRSGLSRAREVRRRTPRRSSRSYSSTPTRITEDSSDKENSGTYSPSRTRSTTEGLSTLESYSRTGSYTPTPSSTSYTPTPSSISYTPSSGSYTPYTDGSASDVPRSSTTAQTSEYVTARSPSELSYTSLPTIPSLHSEYETAEECSTEYDTAPKCPSEVASDYETAEVCLTEAPSEYITAEVCSTDVSTEYDTAECRCAKPEEQEDDVISITPSAIPTIPSSPPSVVEDIEEMRPEDIPLPPSVYSPSVASRELSEEQVPSPSPTEPSEEDSESIPGPSPIPPSESLPELTPSVSSVSSPTESSVSPTPSSLLTPTVPSTIEQPPTPSSPAIPESLWGAESDESYESSMLRASPSVQSLALAEGPDTSFETSFLRPSGSIISSQDMTLLTPITEVSTASSITVPSSPSSSLTPTPSTISLPPSVPSPTPISMELPLPSVTLTRTPSSVSTVSSVSMSSSIFYPRSLLDFPLSVDEPSTEPSLLSTVHSPPPPPPISPPSVPLPPSPSLTAPSVTMSVSISTPRGDVPSVASNIDTVPSEAPAPVPTFTQDVNQLLEELRELAEQRGAENRDLVEGIHEVRGMLQQVLDSLEHPSEAPPPLPRKDRSVGGSSIISSVRSAPQGPRDLSRAVAGRPSPLERAISLSPPPMRLPSPDSSVAETMSFLSSHHSDDFSLLDSDSYPAGPPSPSWPSSPDYSSPSPPPSSLPSSPPSTPSLISEGITPTASPAPSTVSSATARPVPPPNMQPLSDAVAHIRDEIAALRGGQDQILDEIRNRPSGPNLDECCRRLEDAIRRLQDQPQAPRQPPRDDVSESLYPSGSDTSLLEHIAELRAAVGQDTLPIQMPIPARAGPSLIEMLAESMAEGPPPVQQPVQLPPPIIPLMYRPGPRAVRPRSASPDFETDLPPRPSTFPVTQPVRFDDGPRPSRVRRSRLRPSDRFVGPPRVTPSEGDSIYGPGQPPSESGMPPPAGPSQPSLDFDRIVRDRHGGWFEGGQRVPGRPPTAPPDLSSGPLPSGASVPPVPPGQFGISGGQPQGQFVPVAPAPPPTILQIPFDDILALLRDNRQAQVASIENSREVMRYLRDLNDWLGRDVNDRHAEVRGLNARMDELRDLVYELMGERRARDVPRGEAPTAAIPPPPIFPTPGIPGSAEQGRVYPPGFVPQPGPQPFQPGVVPFRDERTPSPLYSPVVPPTPRPYEQGPFTPRIPVVPQAPGAFVQPPPPAMYNMPEEDVDVIPAPVTYTESYTDESESPEIRVVPPPGQIPIPQFQPPVQQPPITIMPQPLQQPQPPTVVHIEQSSPRSRSRSPIRSPFTTRRTADQSPSNEGQRQSPPPVVIHVPTEPSAGYPRHPDAPSAAPPTMIPSPQPPLAPAPGPTYIIQQPGPQPPPLAPEPQVITVREGSRPSSPRSRGEYDQGSYRPEPTTIVVRSSSPTHLSRRELQRSPSRSPPPSIPPVIVPPHPGYVQTQPLMPGQPPIVIQGTPRDETPIVVRSSSRPYGPRDDLYQHPIQRSRSPSPVFHRPSRRSQTPPHRRIASPRQSQSPTLRDIDRSPSPVVVRVPSARPHGSSRRGDGSRRRPSEYSLSESMGRTPPRRVPPHREGSPGSYEGSESDDPRRHDLAHSRVASSTGRRSGPSARPLSRSPSPEFDVEQPRPPRSQRSTRRPSAQRDRSPMRTNIASPISEGSEGEEARTPPLQPLPVRPPSRQSPVVVRTGSRGPPRGPPTYVELERPAEPPSDIAHVVHVPTRPSRVPSGVTVRPTYEESSPEVSEPVELTQSYSGASELGRVLEADRGPPAVSRAPTQRIAPDRSLSPRAEYARQIHQTPEGEPIIPYAPTVAPTIEPAPTITRVPPPRSEAPRFQEEFEEPGGEPYVEERDQPTAPTPVARRARSPPLVPTAVQQYRASGPGDLGYADAERERVERFGELERQLADTVAVVQDGEERRDQNFRANEDERERLFLEHEARRDQEAMQRRDEIWREMEDRLAAIAGGQVPLPVPPPTGVPEPDLEAEVPDEDVGVAPSRPEEPSQAVSPPIDVHSAAESIRSITQDAANRFAQDILETVRLEREEMAREREMMLAERERMQVETQAIHARELEAREARVHALEEELAAVRAELENERQLRLTEESDNRERERIEVQERDEAMRNQLSDVTNLVSEQREELIRKREVADERWAEKQARMDRQEAQMAQMMQMMQQMAEDKEAERIRLEEERAAKANEPTLQQILDSIAELRMTMEDALRNAAEMMRATCAEHHERTVEAVRSTAQEQVPFNVQAYLDEFSRSLALEVRVLLDEVGKAREARRKEQYELGCLLQFRAQFGPDGVLDPNWRPATGPCARDGGGAGAPPAEAAPPEAPPPPPEEPVRPAWRNVLPPRGSRRSRRTQAAAPPPEPVVQVRPQTESWATWQPNPAFQPTPPTVSPNLLVPQPSPGLFGPRSPRDSLAR